MNARGRRALTAGIATVLVLGPAVGGLAYTQTTVQAADHTAETVVLHEGAEQPPEGEGGAPLSDGRQDTALSKALLPVPVTYTLGPDIEEFGNDAYLSGRKAQALLNSGSLGISGGESGAARREFVRKLKVQGMAMRSYVSHEKDLVVHMKLIRMKNEKAVKDLSTFQAELADALSLFREGPKIKGYKNAKCHRLPADDEADLEMMFCTASQGGDLVSMTAFGSKPFKKDDAADMLKQQLDRLVAGGGEQV